MILQKKKYGNFYMIALSFQVSPLYSLIFAVQRILGALLPTISIFVNARFINTAMAVLNKTADIRAIHMPIIFLAAIMVYQVLIGVLMNFVSCRAKIYYRMKLRPEMIEKRARLEYRHIEDPKTADLIKRVCPAVDENIR